MISNYFIINKHKDSLKSYMKDKDQKKYWELLKNLTETDLIIDKLSTMVTFIEII